MGRCSIFSVEKSTVGSVKPSYLFYSLFVAVRAPHILKWSVLYVPDDLLRENIFFPLFDLQSLSMRSLCRHPFWTAWCKLEQGFRNRYLFIYLFSFAAERLAVLA